MPQSIAQLPALAPLATPLTALSKEEMRERQRLHVKRTYYRKLNILQGLRDDVAKLEAEYARLLTQQQRQLEANLMVDENTNYINAHNLNHQSANSKPAQELYKEISLVKDRLRSQNEQMRSALAEYQRYASKIASWMEKDRNGATSSDDESLPGIQQYAPENVSPLVVALVPRLKAVFSMEMCHAVAMKTFADMQNFRRSNDFVTTGFSVFGWRDKRLRQGDRVKFSLKKLFERITPLELSLRGWRVLSSPKGLRSLYSSTMNVSLFTLQRVDENNQIMFRVMTTPDASVAVKTLFMMSRFEIPEGFVILVHSLDRSLLGPHENPPGVVEKWIDYYTWILFERAGEDGEHCKLDFGGEVQSNPVLGSDMWMLEVLLIALRWENHVIGRIFSLCYNSK